MKVNLLNQYDKIALDLVKLKKISSYICSKFDKKPENELNIVFVTSEEIKKLNNLYRKLDKPTDVLSFSYMSENDSFNVKSVENDNFNINNNIPEITGEIIICPEVALHNISKQKDGWDLIHEIVLLIIHGILHIYGFDHENDDKEMEMFNMQQSLFDDVCRRFTI